MPSVIARLMGMEDAATMIQEASQITSINLIIKSSSKQVASQFKDSQSHHGSRSNGDPYYSRRCLSKMKKSRPPRHRHPQEELLHKMKEDFQAWQRKSSEALEDEKDDERLGKSSRSSSKAGLDGRYIQMIARENLRKEKMARYGYGGKRTKVEEDKVVAVKNGERHGDSEASAPKVAEPAGKFFRGLEAEIGEHGHGARMSDKLRGGAPATTRIAILRPTDTCGPVVFGTPSSAKAKRDGSGGRGMEEFLQEVKERLKSEMKVIGAGSDDTKQTAGRVMARQIRETVMAKVDIGKRLYTRSESFRIFRGDRKRAAAVAKSPEHRMQKSVIVSRAEVSSPEKIKRGIMVSSPVTSRGRRAGAMLTDASLSGRTGLGDQQSWTGAGAAVASPRALFRSFSAPASSGISRALAGDSSDTSCEGAEVTRRSRSFSLLRGTVSLPSLRHSFSLGGKLLTMMQFFKNKKPSSSSPQESGNGCADSFAQLSPKCSSEFDAHVSESSSCCQSKAGADAEGDPDKAYVREVLVTAGLCDGDGGGSSSDDTAIARTDSMARRPITGDDVFDEVEESYYSSSRRCDKNAGEEDDDGRDHRHRRMLFDLANEALQEVGSPATSLRRWVVDESGMSLSELTDDVWRQVVQATQNGETQTVDGMVECEVMRSPWLESVQLQEDVSAVGRKIERAILDQLVAEVAREIFV